jgi:hypothetical protein
MIVEEEKGSQLKCDEIHEFPPQSSTLKDSGVQQRKGMESIQEEDEERHVQEDCCYTPQ